MLDNEKMSRMTEEWHKVGQHDNEQNNTQKNDTQRNNIQHDMQ